MFYVGDPEGDSAGFDMGLTRLFKLSHVNGVGAVLARQEHHKHSRGEPDMIEALFGHVYDRADLGIGNDERLAPGETGRKGRISFGFAELSEKTPARGDGRHYDDSHGATRLFCTLLSARTD